MRGLQGLYRDALARTIQSPYPALIIAIVFIVVGLALLPGLGLSLTPSLKQTHLLVQWDAVPSTSGPEMSRISNQISRELQNIGGVLNVGSHVGRAITADARYQFWGTLGQHRPSSRL